MSARLEAVEAVPLRQMSRRSDRYLVVRRADNSVIAEISAEEYAALAVKGARGPRGLTDEEWASGGYCVAGGNPDYGNARYDGLQHGEICDEGDKFVIGLRTDAGLKLQVAIQKSKVVVDEKNGLTLTPVEPFDAALGVVEIKDGFLVTSGLARIPRIG